MAADGATVVAGLIARLRAAGSPLPASLPQPVDPVTGERRSAVLVLADPAAPGVPLLFIRRSRRVSSHRGQIAFPGGGAEPDDAGPAETALREAAEEMGVDPARLEVLGMLEPLTAATSGRHIDPVLALCTGPAVLRPDAFEVAQHFWIRLDRLLDAPVTRRIIPGDPAERRVTFIDTGDRVIWGLTAAIVVDLCARLRGEAVSGSGGG